MRFGYGLLALCSGAAMVHAMVFIQYSGEANASTEVVQLPIVQSTQVEVQPEPASETDPDQATPVLQFSTFAPAPQLTAANNTPAPLSNPLPAAIVVPMAQPQLPPAKISNPTPVPTKPPVIQKTVTSKFVNLDKLSIAVALTETKNCKANQGSALVNNCHGIKRNGKFIAFASPAQSHAYFKQLWVNGYGGRFPSYNMAKKYSGNDRPTSWLNNVTYFYNKL